MIEMIVEETPNGRVEYVGHVVSETDDKIALVSYIAQGKRLPEAVTITKSRISERHQLVKRAKVKVPA